MGVQYRWEAVADDRRAGRAWVLLVRVLVALVRDVAEALGAIVYGVGRAILRLLSVATVVLIVYAILVRATVRCGDAAGRLAGA